MSMLLIAREKRVTISVLLFFISEHRILFKFMDFSINGLMIYLLYLFFFGIVSHTDVNGPNFNNTSFLMSEYQQNRCETSSFVLSQS